MRKGRCLAWGVATGAITLAMAPSASAWSGPITLSVATQDARDPQAAVDDQGDAVFAWTKFNGAEDRIQTRARSAAGPRSGIDTLSPPDRNCTQPAVDIDADGDAVYVWTNDDGTGRTRIQLRTRSASGTYGPIQDLSDPSNGASEPDVAVTDSGAAAIVWRRYDGTHHRIQTTFLPVGGAPTPVQTLSASGENAFEPEVGIDGAGDAVYVWRRSDGLNTADPVAGSYRPRWGTGADSAPFRKRRERRRAQRRRGRGRRRGLRLVPLRRCDERDPKQGPGRGRDAQQRPEHLRAGGFCRRAGRGRRQRWRRDPHLVSLRRGGEPCPGARPLGRRCPERGAEPLAGLPGRLLRLRR